MRVIPRASHRQGLLVALVLLGVQHPASSGAAPLDCSPPPDALNVVISEAPDWSPRCAEPTQLSCIDDYLSFLDLDEVRQNASPRLDCEGDLQRLFLARDARVGSAPWPSGNIAPWAEPGEAILDASNLRFLFEAEGFERRPLEVLITSRTERKNALGAPYRQWTLALRDPFIGEMQALLLLPSEGEGPFASILALPGHLETAEDHRDRRHAQFLPSEGFAVLIPEFRAYEQPQDDLVTRAFLCQGFSLMMLRAYEALVALKYLLASPLACNQRLAVIGHSGGSVVGNLLAWLEVNPAAAHVSDGLAGFHNLDRDAPDGSFTVDCESHPGLYAIAPEINALAHAPRPVLEVPYGFAACVDCPEAGPLDLAALGRFVPFLRRELLGSAEEAPPSP